MSNSPSSEIPKDVIEDHILPRLPSKSLMRFKSVSKRWLSLISSHKFALRPYYSIPKVPNFASFFVVSPEHFITPVSVGLEHSIRIDPNIDLPLPIDDTGAGMPVLVSAGFGIYCVFGNFNGALQMWNPTTRECISLPPPPREFESYQSFYFGKVDFEDGDFSYNVGLITANADEYIFGDQLSQSLELYSSKTKTWTVIQNIYFGEILCYGDGACVNLNRKAHWMTLCQRWDDYVTNITTFDYENGTLGSIPIQLAPEVGHYDMSKGTLSAWDEAFLCLVLFWEKDDNLFLDIWVMLEYGIEDSWNKEFTVGPISKDSRVLGFSSKVQGIFLQEKGSFPTSMKLCDCKSSSIKEFSFPSDHKDQYLQITEHVESLVSVVM